MLQYGNVLVFRSLKGRQADHKAPVSHSETANAMHALLTQLCSITMWWASRGDEHREGLIHCEQTTLIPLPKGKGFFKFLLTPVDYFKELLGLFERHLQ